jgi:hypothetical protein
LGLSGEPDEAAAVGLKAIQVAKETNAKGTMRVLTRRGDHAVTLTRQARAASA